MVINRTPRRWILTLALCIGLAVLTAGPVQAAPARVRILDLGTLGGTFSDAIAINDRGQIAGTSTTASGHARSFIWQRGKLMDLGTLTGGSMRTTAMNNRGDVVGIETELPDGLITHAFLWRGGVLRDLGTLGGDSANAWNINDRGQVVGDSVTTYGSTHAFLWDKGVMTDLGTLGGQFSSASVVNDRGQVIGLSTNADGFGIGFLWDRGRLTEFGPPDSASAAVVPVAINRRGQVVAFHDPDFQGARGWTGFWDGRTLIDIGDLDFGFSAPSFLPNQALNDRGQVVGTSSVASYFEDGATHAYLWQRGVMQDLGTLGGLRSSATAINNSGMVTGTSQTTEEFVSHPFLWRRGVMTDIGTLGRSADPVDLNERGDIVGSALTVDGQQHAVLWTSSRHITG